MLMQMIMRMQMLMQMLLLTPRLILTMLTSLARKKLMVILLKNDNLNVNKIDNIFTENAMHTIQ